MHALAGIRRPIAGEVRLDGTPLSMLGATARARRIGLLLQEESVEFWGSVLDYACLGRYPHRRSLFGWEAEDERLAREQLERMDLTPVACRGLTKLSGGERQRARLALILTQDPVFYLLDEPLQHLDLRHQLQVLECFAGLARTSGKAAVMVLHDPRLARQVCDHALLLFDSGSVLAGPASGVLTADNLKRLYGVPVPL
jgi:iron complex transport system ATP-binding protein